MRGRSEKQPAKGPEKEQVTGMEVEESEESDFEPVVKSRRKMTTEIKVDDGQGVEKLLSNNKYSPLADKTTNNNNANPTTEKSTPVATVSGKPAGDENGNNNANPAAGKPTPVVPSQGKSAGAKKQPPLVVKNLSFTRLAKVMSTCDVQPEHKLTRNGIKKGLKNVFDEAILAALEPPEPAKKRKCKFL